MASSDMRRVGIPRTTPYEPSDSANQIIDWSSEKRFETMTPQEQEQFLGTTPWICQEFFQQRVELGRYLFDRLAGETLVPLPAKPQGWSSEVLPPTHEQVEVMTNTFVQLRRHRSREDVLSEPSVEAAKMSWWVDQARLAKPVFHCHFPMRILIAYDFEHSTLPIFKVPRYHTMGSSLPEAVHWSDLAPAQWRQLLTEAGLSARNMKPPCWTLMCSITSLIDAAFIRSLVYEARVERGLSDVFDQAQLPKWPGVTFSMGTSKFEALLATLAGKACVSMMLSMKSDKAWKSWIPISVTAFALPDEDRPSLLFSWNDTARVPNFPQVMEANSKTDSTLPRSYDMRPHRYKVGEYNERLWDV